MPIEEAVVLRDLRAPFDDLLSMVEKRRSLRVLDIGAGPEDAELSVSSALDVAELVRLDASEPETLAALLTRALKSRTYDLVVSTAPLHLARDHAAVVHRLAGHVDLRGQLAIQMRANDDHQANTIAAAVARQFGLDPRPTNVLSLDAYAEILFALGFKRQHVRMQVYGRLLKSTAELFDCVRDTILAAYEPSLSAPTFERFLRAYRDELRDGITSASPYFFADKRLLIWASM